MNTLKAIGLNILTRILGCGFLLLFAVFMLIMPNRTLVALIEIGERIGAVPEWQKVRERLWPSDRRPECWQSPAGYGVGPKTGRPEPTQFSG